MSAEKKATKKVRKLTLRLLEEEHERLKQLADEAGLTINDFIRVKLLKFKPPKKKPQKDCEEKRGLLYEIHKIGVNINQIAKLVNWLVKEDLPDEESLKHLERIADSLENIETALHFLLSEVERN